MRNLKFLFSPLLLGDLLSKPNIKGVTTKNIETRTASWLALDFLGCHSPSFDLERITTGFGSIGTREVTFKHVIDEFETQKKQLDILYGQLENARLKEAYKKIITAGLISKDNNPLVGDSFDGALEKFSREFETKHDIPLNEPMYDLLMKRMRLEYDPFSVIRELDETVLRKIAKTNFQEIRSDIGTFALNLFDAFLLYTIYIQPPTTDVVVIAGRAHIKKVNFYLRQLGAKTICSYGEDEDKLCCEDYETGDYLRPLTKEELNLFDKVEGQVVDVDKTNYEPPPEDRILWYSLPSCSSEDSCDDFIPEEILVKEKI